MVIIKGNYYGDKTFPSLNNLLTAYAKKPIVGANMKREYKNICSWEIRKQLRGWQVEKPIIIHYTFYEPAKGQKRDFMNVFSMFDKCFEDALQDCKVIPNDSPAWVKNTTHEFCYTEDIPYVVIEIEEIE